MRKSTIKVAELATILYAILVLMSLLIDSAYYSQFNIRIVSYMSISEILLSCIERFHEFALPLLASIAGLILYHFIAVDPLFKVTLNPLDWFSKVYDQNRTLSHRFYFYFGQRKSVHAKYSIVEHYNFIIFLLPFIVGFSTLAPLSDIIFKYSSSIAIIWGVLMGYGLIIVFFIGNYNYFQEKNYDWSKHPLYEKMYADAKYRKSIAPHHFTRTEKKMIELNYKYRHVLVCLSFFVSLFVSLYMGMYYTAKDIKENGNDHCVVMMRNGNLIDTRTQNIDYIGESAGFIFIYDRATQGTMVYERHSLDSYLFVKKSLYNANSINTQESRIAQTYHSHIKQSLLDTLVQRNENIPCDFVFEYPHMNYQLVTQELNHYIWLDTTNNTFLEQITMPKDMYERQPSSEDLFDIELYTKNEDRWVQYGGDIIQTTYQGKNGENILTLVCTGKNYSAWLFYDPTGRNIQYGDEIFKSLTIKYSYGKQVEILYSNMPKWDKISYLSMFALLSGTFLIFSFLFVRKAYKKRQGKNDFIMKDIRKEIIALVLVSFIACFFICYLLNPFGNTINVIIAFIYTAINCLIGWIGYKLGVFVYKKPHSIGEQ